MFENDLDKEIVIFNGDEEKRLGYNKILHKTLASQGYPLYEEDIDEKLPILKKINPSLIEYEVKQ